MNVRFALIAVPTLLFSMSALGADATDALLRKNKCTMCHSADKVKVGPSYKDIAARHKGKADAAEAVYTHLTTGPEVTIDGAKEAHPVLKGKEEEIRAAVTWILAQ